MNTADQPTVDNLEQLDPAEVERITRADEVLSDLDAAFKAARANLHNSAPCVSELRDLHLAGLTPERADVIATGFAIAMSAIDTAARCIAEVRRG